MQDTGEKQDIHSCSLGNDCQDAGFVRLFTELTWGKEKYSERCPGQLEVKQSRGFVTDLKKWKIWYPKPLL